MKLSCCFTVGCPRLTPVQVKPNVGHSEGASGLTSLIKAILALEHKTIPPNIKFSQPNPKSKVNPGVRAGQGRPIT